MAESRKAKRNIPDDTSSDEEVPHRLQTTEEEREGTIPGSAIATCVALAAATAQGNPVVPRGLPKPRYETRRRRKPDNPTTETAVQTESKVKTPPVSPVTKSSDNGQQKQTQGSHQGR